jgi:hypothetical protein
LPDTSGLSVSERESERDGGRQRARERQTETEADVVTVSCPSRRRALPDTSGLPASTHLHPRNGVRVNVCLSNFHICRPKIYEFSV